MDSKDNPYEILGVSEDATDADIKKAFRKGALKYHPDKQQTEADKEEAHHIFAKLAAAYETVSDEEKRCEWHQKQEEKVRKQQQREQREGGAAVANGGGGGRIHNPPPHTNSASSTGSRNNRRRPQRRHSTAGISPSMVNQAVGGGGEQPRRGSGESATRNRPPVRRRGSGELSEGRPASLRRKGSGESLGSMRQQLQRRGSGESAGRRQPRRGSGESAGSRRGPRRRQSCTPNIQQPGGGGGGVKSPVKSPGRSSSGSPPQRPPASPLQRPNMPPPPIQRSTPPSRPPSRSGSDSSKKSRSSMISFGSRPMSSRNGNDAGSVCSTSSSKRGGSSRTSMRGNVGGTTAGPPPPNFGIRPGGVRRRASLGGPTPQSRQPQQQRPNNNMNNMNRRDPFDIFDSVMKDEFGDNYKESEKSGWKQSKGVPGLSKMNIFNRKNKKKISENSKKEFKKLDINKDKTLSKNELSVYISTHKELWEMLSNSLNLNITKCTDIATNVAFSLATGEGITKPRQNEVLRNKNKQQRELTEAEFTNFHKNYVLKSKGSQEFYLRTIFAAFDTNGDGVLQRNELNHFLDVFYKAKNVFKGDLKLPCKQELQRTVLKRLDKNRDGALSFNEMRKLLEVVAVVTATTDQVKQ